MCLLLLLFSVLSVTLSCLGFCVLGNTGKAGQQLDKAVSELKTSGDAGETIEKVEQTVKGLTSQATKLSTDYDLPAKAKQALGVAGELADTAIVKVMKQGYFCRICCYPWYSREEQRRGEE